MTIKELREAIAELPDDMLVVMSKDGEGNGYSPLSGVDQSMYRADSTWSGEIAIAALTDEAREQGYSDEDVGTKEDGYEPAVVLWPTN